ncbi:MAG TPA: M42 family peptidase [Solirubrobacteraceae bacterium]|nr:M42 family peptidase [Solirubrobacteraceae bacterium]
MSPAPRRAGGRAAPVPPLLLELLAARAPSGAEQDAREIWLAAAAEFAATSVDRIGSARASVAAKGRGEHKRIILVGHIDEIGLLVTHIDDQGYLWFAPVGGWDPQVLVGQRVVVKSAGGELRGVIGRKPLHLLKAEERKKVPELRELHIDIGARDGAQARKMARVGDVAVIDSGPLELPNRRLVSRALDNRLGCYVALEAARIVAQAGGGEWEVIAVAAVQEEIDLGGSTTSAFSLEPDAAVVIDVTHATDAPGVDPKSAGPHELGTGPVVGRGTTLSGPLGDVLEAAGKAGRIPHTVAAYAESTWTDTDGIYKSRGGIPTALVEIPLRYMHSPTELVEVRDVENAAKLLGAAALRLRRSTDLSP